MEYDDHEEEEDSFDSPLERIREIVRPSTVFVRDAVTQVDADDLPTARDELRDSIYSRIWGHAPPESADRKRGVEDDYDDDDDDDDEDLRSRAKKKKKHNPFVKRTVSEEREYLSRQRNRKENDDDDDEDDDSEDDGSEDDYRGAEGEYTYGVDLDIFGENQGRAPSEGDEEKDDEDDNNDSDDDACSFRSWNFIDSSKDEGNADQNMDDGEVPIKMEREYEDESYGISVLS